MTHFLYIQQSLVLLILDLIFLPRTELLDGHDGMPNVQIALQLKSL